jgi:hypothetical protein
MFVEKALQRSLGSVCEIRQRGVLGGANPFLFLLRKFALKKAFWFSTEAVIPDDQHDILAAEAEGIVEAV